jgi:hypothetical protein
MVLLQVRVTLSHFHLNAGGCVFAPLGLDIGALTLPIFDAGNNRYRVIGRIIYAKRRLYILKATDHKEYDKNRSVDEYGCHKPPPKRPTAAKIRTPKPPKRR